MEQEEVFFDSTKIEKRDEDSPIPDGEYTVVITKVDLAPAKSNPLNSRLNLEYQVIDGEHKNRRVWEGLNIKHTDPNVQKWGEQTLKSICEATGVLVLRSKHDLQQLSGKMLIIRTKNKARKDDPSEIETKIKAYAPYGRGIEVRSVPPVQTAQVQPQISVPVTTNAAPLWKR